ncbi:hypothetical protein L873DRAFT_1916036, partial [Choiromyces venosus 120613-1]
ALFLVLFHLSCPHHYNDCIETFGHGQSWLSCVFNGTCLHINRQWYKILQWNHALLAPVQLTYYCQKIQEKDEISGLIWVFVDGMYKQIYHPRPETEDQEIIWSGHKHMHSIQFLITTIPDGMISCTVG